MHENFMVRDLVINSELKTIRNFNSLITFSTERFEI